MVAIVLNTNNGGGSVSQGISLVFSGVISNKYYSLYRTVASAHYGPTFFPLYVVGDDDIVVWDHRLLGFGGSGVVIDYGAPINETITYHIEEFDAIDLVNPVDSSTVAYVANPGEDFEQTGFAIISDPFTLDTAYAPDAYTVDYVVNVTGTVIDFSPTVRSAKILGRHEILGRKNAVTLSSGLGGRKGTIGMMNLSTITTNVGGEARTASYDVISKDATGGWPVIFESGNTLLFRSDWRDTGIDDFYFKPLSLEDVRIYPIVGSQGSGQMPLKYTFDWEEVDLFFLMDPGEVAPTWQVVAVHNATWADVNSAHADWADVVANPSA